MNERIVFTNPDGSVDVLTPADDYLNEINASILGKVTRETLQSEGESDTDFHNRSSSAISDALWDMPKFLDFIQNKDVPAGATNARQITVAELPEDRLFRGAWDDSNPESFIGVDLTKAKLIAHNVRRTDREDKMEPLDREGGFASTSATRKSEIATEKQDILDANAMVQTDIESCADEVAIRTILVGGVSVALLVRAGMKQD